MAALKCLADRGIAERYTGVITIYRQDGKYDAITHRNAGIPMLPEGAEVVWELWLVEAWLIRLHCGVWKVADEEIGRLVEMALAERDGRSASA